MWTSYYGIAFPENFDGNTALTVDNPCALMVLNMSASDSAWITKTVAQWIRFKFQV